MCKNLNYFKSYEAKWNDTNHMFLCPCIDVKGGQQLHVNKQQMDVRAAQQAGRQTIWNMCIHDR